MRRVVGHVIVAALIAGMIGAGFWQISRHRDRAARNDLIRARTELARVDVGELTGPAGDSDSYEVGERERFRPVSATGEFAVEDEVLVRNRTLDGSPGWWVLTPLVTDDGSAVIVNRGWIPRSFSDDQARPGTEPAAGSVTVEGWVQPTVRPEGLQAPDPAVGRLTSLARPDIERLAAQLNYPVLPLLVLADAPGAAELPRPLELPPLDGGPHLGYAVQWFIFAAIAIIGYPLILRRQATNR